MSDLQLTHAVTGNGSTLEIAVTGRLAIDTAAELQSLLLDQIGPVSTVQMNLSAVDGIDLAGIQLICSACSTALDAEKRFNFSGVLPAEVQKMIADAGLNRRTTCKNHADLPCIWCGGIN